MVDPAKVAFFVPREITHGPKLALFGRVADSITRLGGRVIGHDHEKLEQLPGDVLPIVGCSPYLRPTIARWRATGRRWIYWDRGYARRVYATWLPRGEDGGYYRWHLNSFQMQTIREAQSDRWDALRQPISPWQRNPDGHILIAAPSRTYAKFHGIESWLADALYEISVTGTRRELRLRDKESKRPLADDLRGALCCVTHGSNTAVEAAILGCPVFVHPDSAARLVGLTDLKKIEHPLYIENREAWCHSLAYSQFTERELIDGTLWRLLR